MKSRLLALGLLLVPSILNAGAALPDPATKDKVPPIAIVQAMIWKRLDLADFTLTGSVRSDKTKISYPITLRTKGHELVYEFNNQPLQIRVQLNPGSVVVEKRASPSGSWAPITAADRAKAIFGTDVTYEDLGIDFVNWDDIQPLGTDNIKTLDAYVFEAKPGPNDHSRFASVRFWVSKQYWTFLRIDGVNAKGQTVKRVEVQNVMKVADKYYVFKEMKVATMAPDKDDIASSTTFIDIDDGKEGSGL
ncbi:MAG: outer membrane lipoprotein-sorting protein [Methylacidiphilales bacterium]|nr:outer membrane lipoprotein-sorting protein [Candidatus Methylacidiphilales bacterium]